MPKQGSTVERTNDIVNIFNGVRCKPIAEMEYLDDEWKSFDDVKSFSFSRSSKNKDVGRFALYPIPQQMNADIDNRFSKYSPGTESIFAGVIRRNLPIRASIGYALDDAVSKQYDYALAGLGELCYAQELNGKIYNSPVRGSGSVPYGFTFTLWDGDEYDELTLAIDGYYQSSIIDFGAFKTKTLKQFKLTSDTTAISVYYRTASVREDLTDNIGAYTLLGSTIVGEKTFSLPDIESRYFQFMLLFNTNVWSSTTGYATGIKVIYDDVSEMFPLGEFLLDTASWSSSPDDKSLSISARDKLKKALETKVSTDAYTGYDVAEIMRDVADRASIPHNDGIIEYIPDSGYVVDIVAHKNETAINIFEEQMQYLNAKNEYYRLFVNDLGYLELDDTPKTSNNFDWIFSQDTHLFSLSRDIDTDNILQRLTIFSSSENNKTGGEEILASDTYTTVGTKTLTWSGKSLNKRYSVIITRGTFTVNHFDNEEIEIEVGGDNPSVSITIYGDKVEGGFSGFCGEAVKQDFIEQNDGFSKSIVNRYVQSDTEAREIAEALIARFGGENQYTLSFSIDGFPLLELGDVCLVLEKSTNTSELFVVESIGVSYNADNAQYKMSVKLGSLGFTLSDYVYDRNFAITGMFVGIYDLQYDIAYYDIHFWASEEDDPETYNRNVLFSPGAPVPPPVPILYYYYDDNEEYDFYFNFDMYFIGVIDPNTYTPPIQFS